MKTLTKIWGIGLALVLAFSLIFSVAPVSAGTLSWGSEDLPDEFVDTAGDNIVDMDVSGDGSTIYAVVSSNQTYRSSNGGSSWTTSTVIDGTDVMASADFIAVAPDDPNYVATCNGTGPHVFISDDAGANWDTLGMVEAATFVVSDLAISVEKSGKHYVSVAGADTGGAGEVWTYQIGAIGAVWDEVSADSGYDTCDNAAAVEFSPNFYSDQVMVAVTSDMANDEIHFQVYSFNQGTWNSGAFSDYPTNMVQSSETPASLEAAAIAMAPDYLGSDEDMRVVFVGLAVDGATAVESEGIFRMDDTDIEVLKDKKAICSIAFDGSLLVAGRQDSTGVYRSTDALEDSPSVSSSTGTKEPGGSSLALVGIAGSKVVVGTSGDNSAFAYSEDNGKTFNDISLIDTDITTIEDVAVSPDGSSVYMVTGDSDTVSDLSIWRLGSSWERIFTKDGYTSDYIIRLAPDDPDVIYAANVTGTDIYFSADGGMGKWHTRVYKESSGVTDLAVETDGDTVYVLTTSGYVSKSTNRGFVWDSKKSSKLTGGSSMITSLGEDKLVAGSLDGRVAYSTDGNSSWTKLSSDGFSDTGIVQATATGLDDGDFVIAGADDDIYAWELGSDDEWGAITDAEIPTGYDVSGIGIWEGSLYAVADNSTGVNSIMLRTLTPTSDDPTWSTATLGTELLSVSPTALRASVSGDVTRLWAIDTTSGDMGLFSYKDSLAVTPVTMKSPTDGSVIPFNPVSGDSSQIVFTWVTPSDKVTDYDFEIATDTAFDEILISDSVAKSSGTWDSGTIISKIVGPGAASPFNVAFMPETTYYWRVRVDAAGPVRSAWSETRSFTTGGLPEAQAPVIIEQGPAPVISVPAFPEIVLQPPEIVLPAPVAAPEIVIPAAPAPTPAVPSWAIYAIIIIGAVLVIALIVLIMRTRRPV